MTYNEMIELGLEDDGQIKIILKGSVESNNTNNVGIVAVVFVTADINLARDTITKFNKYKKAEDFYMVYSCPENVDLTTLNHFPSLEISMDDLSE